MMRLLEFDAWARAHHGLITREASGMSRSAWQRAIEAGALDRLHPGVARLPGTPRSPEQDIAAAVLAGGPGTIASHRSAARLWGIPRPDDDPVDVIHTTRSERRLAGVIAHRPRDRRRLTPQRRNEIPCTNILRTVLDLAAVDPWAARGAVGHALTHRLADLNALESTAVQHARQGRPGTPALRAAIDAWSIDAKPADSVLEPAMLRVVRRYRLPPVEFHPVIEGFEVDFRVIGTPVILECDGWAHHGLDREAFERDRRRDARLVAAGWLVLRFTYRSITRAPKSTAKRIANALARWQHVPAPDLGRL